MNDLLIVVIITIVIAFLGYIIIQDLALRSQRRKERLERVNRQIKDLYGPLFALTQSSNRAWRAFIPALKKKFPIGRAGIFDQGEEVDPEMMQVWVTWMRTVFMPTNEKIFSLITENSDLVIEKDIPQFILDFLAHIVTYRTVMKKWDDGDYSEYTSIITFPENVTEYCQKSYEVLKSEQLKLLGK